MMGKLKGQPAPNKTQTLTVSPPILNLYVTSTIHSTIALTEKSQHSEKGLNLGAGATISFDAARLNESRAVLFTTWLPAMKDILQGQKQYCT